VKVSFKRNKDYRQGPLLMSTEPIKDLSEFALLILREFNNKKELF